jgi:predicted TIM-barrel enzyme
MLHAGALPGTPSARDSIETPIERSLTEARIYRHAVCPRLDRNADRAIAHQARIYRDAGFTAPAIENMHDRPYLNGAVGPEITASMTVLAREVKRETGLPTGIQILAAANRL